MSSRKPKSSASPGQSGPNTAAEREAMIRRAKEAAAAVFGVPAQSQSAARLYEDEPSRKPIPRPFDTNPAVARLEAQQAATAAAVAAAADREAIIERAKKAAAAVSGVPTQSKADIVAAAAAAAAAQLLEQRKTAAPSLEVAGHAALLSPRPVSAKRNPEAGLSSEELFEESDDELDEYESSPVARQKTSSEMARAAIPDESSPVALQKTYSEMARAAIPEPLGPNEIIVDEEEEEEEEEEEGFWQLIEREYFESQSETTPVPKLTELEIIKNTVHQQIFLGNDRAFLKKLGREFNCEIYFRRNNDRGKYALFIIPRDTNYMINVTNGKGGAFNRDRVFFNISLKPTDTSKKEKIKTEFISEYNVHNIRGRNLIFHSYKMPGKPPVFKKNRVDLSLREKIFNPYLNLNNLITEYLSSSEEGRFKVLMTTPLGDERTRGTIKYQIDRLRRRNVHTLKPEIFNKIERYFKDEKEKAEIDKVLTRNFKFLKRFMTLSVDQTHTTAEEIHFKIPNKELYKSNTKFTNRLALRYARHTFIDNLQEIEPVPPFRFTKSYNGLQTYTDPLKCKLLTPFTATDIYLHKFDRRFGEQYAMDRYQVNTPKRLHRLADLVELSKSIMFNFLNMSYSILSSEYNEAIYRYFHFSSIYPGLVWNGREKPMDSSRFKIHKFGSEGKFRSIEISPLTSVESELRPFKYMYAYEIPFDGINSPFDENNPDTGFQTYTHRPVVPDESKLNDDEYDLYGVEWNMLNETEIDATYLDKLHEDFFSVSREQVKELSDERREYQATTGSQFTAEFPELVAARRDARINAPLIGVTPSRVTPIVSPFGVFPEVTKRDTKEELQLTDTPTETPKPPKTAEKKTAAQVLTTEIPFMREVLDKLKQIEATTTKEGFSRSERHRELKKLNEEYITIRTKLNSELQRLKRNTPEFIIRLEQKLKGEGHIPYTRSEDNYRYIKDDMEKRQTELREEAEKIRKFGAISKTQEEIKALMQQIHDIKYAAYITHSTQIIAQTKEYSINAKTFQDFIRRQRDILKPIPELEERLTLLRKKDIEQQARIIATTIRLETKAAEKAESEEEKKEKERLASIEKEKKFIERIRKNLTDLNVQANKIDEFIKQNISSATPQMQAYFRHAMKIVNSAIESYKKYTEATEYLGHAKEKKRQNIFTDEDLEPFITTYATADAKQKAAIELFKEIEANLQKSPEELNDIANAYVDRNTFTGAKKTSDTFNSDDVVNRAAYIPKSQRKTTEIETEDQRFDRELAEKALRERNEFIIAALTEHSEDIKKAIEAALIEANNKKITDEKELKKIKEKAENDAKDKIKTEAGKEIDALNQKEYERFLAWSKLNKQHLDRIKELEEEIKRISDILSDTNTKITNSRLPPREQAKLLSEKDNLEKILILLNSVLNFKISEHNLFLLEHTSYIKYNYKFKPSQRAELLEKIDKFRTDPSNVKTKEQNEEIFYTNLLKYEKFINSLTDTVKKYLEDKLKKAKLAYPQETCPGGGRDCFVSTPITPVAPVAPAAPAAPATPASKPTTPVASKKSPQVVKTKEDEEADKKFLQWKKAHDKLLDIIKKVNTALEKHQKELENAKRLADISPTDKKVINRRDTAKNNVSISKESLADSVNDYNDFLLKNKDYIENIPDVIISKDPTLNKMALLQRIEEYKKELATRPSGSSSSSSDEE
jgi:hypothetical protein